MQSPVFSAKIFLESEIRLIKKVMRKLDVVYVKGEQEQPKLCNVAISCLDSSGFNPSQSLHNVPNIEY